MRTLRLFKNNVIALKVGVFLAYRQIKRASLWTTLLIIFIMMLTFLNLVVVSGILVGLIEGSERAYRTYYSGDVIVQKFKNKDDVENTEEIVSVLNSIPEVKAYTSRLTTFGNVEANYHSRKLGEQPNQVGANISGIDPVDENKATNISKFIVAGEYLDPSDQDGILVGSNYLDQYSVVPEGAITLLKGVRVGSKVRVTIGDTMKEFTVRGILKAKVDDISLRFFMNASIMRQMLHKSTYNASEIAIVLKNQGEEKFVKSILVNNGLNDQADIKTYVEAEPKFLVDIKNTFALLGNAISSIGLVVAAITLFIVIFINAFTRKRYIGIMKGIGVHETAIEVSYVIQSFFYAIIGSSMGLFLVYAVIMPFFDAHPIDFPFSDGILVAPLSSTLLRVLLLSATTIIAGYIPAKMIVKKNTLQSILGK